MLRRVLVGLVPLLLAAQDSIPLSEIEREAVRTGVPLPLKVGKNLTLMVGRSQDGICTILFVEKFGDWLFSGTVSPKAPGADPLFSAVLRGRQCERLWAAIWKDKAAEETKKE